MRKYPTENILRFLSLLCLTFLLFACSASNEKPDTDANASKEIKAKLVYISIPG